MYKLIDRPKPPGSLEPYGLLREDESRRPGYDAYRVVTTHFAGFKGAILQQQGPGRGRYASTAATRRPPWCGRTARTRRTFDLPAIAAQALLVDKAGKTQTIAAEGGRYALKLEGATCTHPGCIIGGSPWVLVEDGRGRGRGHSDAAANGAADRNVHCNPAADSDRHSQPDRHRHARSEPQRRTATPTPTARRLRPHTATPTPTPTPVKLFRADSDGCLRVYMVWVVGLALIYFGAVCLVVFWRWRKKIREQTS